MLLIALKHKEFNTDITDVLYNLIFLDNLAYIVNNQRAYKHQLNNEPHKQV